MPKQNYITSLLSSLSAGPQSSLSGYSPAGQKKPSPLQPFMATQPKPQPNMSILAGPMSKPLPANSGATAPTPPKITTPTTTKPSTGIADSVNKRLQTGPYYPGGPSALATAVKNDPQTLYRNSLLSGGDSTFTSNTSFDFDEPPKKDSTSAYKTAFDTYLESLKPSKEVGDATKALADLNSTIFGKNFSARKQYEEILGRDSGTLGGAQMGANASARRSDSELADLAVRQNAAANTLQALIAADAPAGELAKARLDYEKTLLGSQPEGFTLGAGQTRYDAEGNIIAGGTDGGAGSFYTPGSDPTADAWVKLVNEGKAKMENVPDEYKGIVAQGLSGAPKVQSETKQTALSLVNELLGMDTNAITGIPGISAFIPGSSTQLTKNTYDQLKNLLSLENRQLLKGSGAISDYEFKVLEKASSKLGTNLSNADFKKVLTDLKKDLSVEEGGLAADEREYLKSRGYSDEMIRSLESPQSFNSVGGDTKSAMNRPQRNNNPLNIKASAATSTYPGVKGTDPKPASDGGKFLVFESPAAGFAAAKRLIQADSYRNLTVDKALKRWSNSGYGGEIVPSLANRTIASLSPAQLDTLIKTMAKREGYTA